VGAYLLYGGNIHTMAREGVVEAMLVVGEKVQAVGEENEVRPVTPHNVEEVNLKGRAVFPGFHDAHIHFLQYALGLKRVNLHGVPTLEEGLKLIEAAVKKAKPGSWVVGAGWDKSLWRRFPTRHELDAVSGDIPVVLRSKDGHSIWVNGKALEIARVTRDTPTPEGGAILRDADGEPIGILQDAAEELVWRFVPRETEEERLQACAQAIPNLWKMGITCVHAPDEVELFEIARRIRDKCDVPFRFALMPPISALSVLSAFEIGQGYGDDWVWTAQIKMFKDGSLGSSTALLFEPYEHIPGYCGVEVTSDEELMENVRKCIEAGYGAAVHAIGDKAVARTLDILEAHLSQSRLRGIRHRIEHTQMVRPQDVPRFSKMGVIASVQPAHVVADRYMAEREWGARSRMAYPFGQLKKSGTLLVFGSDAPVEIPDPIFGLYCAVNRSLPGEGADKEWHPDEKLSVEDSIAAYTHNAAYAVGRENVLGELVPGKYADFVILSQDPTKVHPYDIARIEVEALAIAGRFVIEPR